MCLYYNIYETEDFIKKNEGKTFVTCYKVLTRVSNINPFLTGWSFFFKYFPGWNKSSRYDVCLSNNEKNSLCVHEGIHVYTSLRSLKANYFNNTVPKYRAVVKVRCRMDELVGCGDGEAVFTRVWLDEKEWRAAHERLSNE